MAQSVIVVTKIGLWGRQFTDVPIVLDLEIKHKASNIGTAPQPRMVVMAPFV